MRRCRGSRHGVLAISASALLVLAACGGSTSSGPGGGWATMVPLPTGAAAGSGTHATAVVSANPGIVTADLGQNSPTDMFIHMSSVTAPAGKVTFVVQNDDTQTHEFVVLKTDHPAAGFPIGSFEGEQNRIDEDTAGTNVGETGDMKGGSSKTLTIDLPPGHYAIVCNLPGHYAAGMHVDFFATPPGSTPVVAALGDTSPTEMFIHMSSPSAPAGPVSFIVSNESTDMKHELVGFQTKTAANAFPITGFEGDPNKIDEDTAGKVVLDTGADLPPGTAMMITVNLAEGHYALVCNLSGHYAAGMHVDFFATPPGAVVDAELGQTSDTDMFIHLSSSVAPTGSVSFVVANDDTVTHEFVVLQTDHPAAGFPIGSFEGESNRIDEDTAGTNVGETGDMKAGTSQLLTIDMPAGHFAIVCNLPGHYAAGMHDDFWTATT
ncbi:MAG TPA: sulfocyanin-like copper-binding protein [Actinomycetota bacterium]|nr:sulfocyanin-like copper-binding protein [Actinomycetota bacterium]